MAPNIRYINQSAPFWDWIATFEDSATNHPFFNNNNNNNNNSGPSAPPTAGGPPPGPWGRPDWWHGAMPHHGGPPPPFAEAGQSSSETEKEKEKDAMDTDTKEKGEPAADPPEDTPGEHRRRGCHGKRAHCGHGGPGGFGGFGGPGGAHGHHGHGHGHGGRGFGGRRHPYGRWGGPRGFGFLSELFPGAGGEQTDNSNDWQPDADVFDTESAFVVHLSLPGAKKEDVGVSWDPEKSELSVTGVVHRPGDEAFLKTLALDERKTGVFERKIRLGTRANPAQVDVDGITAKLENGILVVEVPKLNGEFVEIKKVDIE